MKLKLNIPDQVVEAICDVRQKPEEQDSEEFVTNLVVNTLRMAFVDHKKKQLESETIQKYVDEANALSFAGD